MIVDFENRFVIATPTKCGTTSIESLAKSRGERLGLAAVRPRQHRMVLPDELADYRRFLAVRNPYDRLVSIYLYLTNPSNYSQWAHWEVVDKPFKEFIPWYIKQRARYNIHLATANDNGEAQNLNWYRSPNLWLVSLAECHDVLEPDGGLVRLEHLAADLEKTGRKNWGGKMLHSNRSTNRKKDSRSMYSKRSLSRVNDAFARRDCEMLGYEVWEG